MLAALLLQVLVQPTDPGMYRVHSPHFVVPCLVPLLQYTFKVGGAVCGPLGAVQHSTAQHMSCGPDACLLTTSLVPSLYTFIQADVTCTQPELGSGTVKVMLVGSAPEGGGAPLLITASVKMPQSEPED
jgi:hypothetical protein